MSFYGTLTHCKVAAVEDMRTSAVYGLGDEKLGEIDEAVNLTKAQLERFPAYNENAVEP